MWEKDEVNKAREKESERGNERGEGDHLVFYLIIKSILEIFKK